MNQKGFYLESIILLFFIGKIKADWGSADSSQYHIQTDEGPERFFRYQTDSGQFRNEKRLKDGTVIGTEAWVDALGYLRQKDYIADKDGYRILKSKTIFIGKDRPIKDVISNGRINTKFLESTTPASTPILSIPSLSSVPHANAIDDDFGYPKRKTPSILVHFNAEPIDGSSKNVYIPPISTTTTHAPPITTYKPILSTTTSTYTTSVYPSSTPIYSSTTSLPPLSHSTAVALPSKYFLPPFSESDNSPIIRIKPYNSLSNPVAAYTIEQINNELQPPLFQPVSLNEFGGGASISSTSAPSIYSSTPSLYNTKSVVPLFNRNAYYRGVNKRPIAYYQPNQLDLNSDEKHHFDRYNARIANGFGYYLPRHYHEETYREANANNRDGSYGYIDPFGIRRVVYYHASPDGGFKIRKNNRYVGFNAKPYDSKK